MEGLLTLPPDQKMAKCPESFRPTGDYESEKTDKWYDPLDEFSMAAYRTNWDPSPDNCDHARGADWKDNPRRFALVGRPQIGKTGVFLHLIYLLHQLLGITARDDRELPQDESEEELDDELQGELQNMGPHPDIRHMQSAKFDDADKECNGWEGCKSCSCYVNNDGSPKNGFEPLKFETPAGPTKFGGCAGHAPGCGKCESAADHVAHCL